MPIRRVTVIIALLLVGGFGSLSAIAGMPSGCTDLDPIPPQPAVDYESQIQPIFSACTGCHASGGAAGLDLRAGEAYANLVGVTSTTSPPQLRVQPLSPSLSLLLPAVNCQVTGGPSFQMPGTDPAQRALIRDWIAQGALERPAPYPIPALKIAGLILLATLLVLAVTGLREGILRTRG